MDVNSQYELESITNELSSIISELESISSGLRTDFSNIGTDKSADVVDNACAKYRSALYSLYNIDTTAVVDGFNTFNG